MPYSPIADILDDLRAGKMVILQDDPRRENEGDLVVAAEKVTPELVHFFLKEARGKMCLAMPEEGDIEAARARLEAGEDFVALVRELSVDDSRSSDGLVPFLVDDARSPLARIAFLTEPGTVGGPVRVAGHALLVRVEEARAPLEGPWSEVGDAVEASLALHPLRDSEFLPWKLAMRRSHAVDLTALE